MLMFIDVADPKTNKYKQHESRNGSRSQSDENQRKDLQNPPISCLKVTTILCSSSVSQVCSVVLLQLPMKTEIILQSVAPSKPVKMKRRGSSCSPRPPSLYTSKLIPNPCSFWPKISSKSEKRSMLLNVIFLISKMD